jgi:TolA-binding protein
LKRELFLSAKPGRKLSPFAVGGWTVKQLRKDFEEAKAVADEINKRLNDMNERVAILQEQLTRIETQISSMVKKVSESGND